jgi:biopolymer transport protein ExbD
MKFPRTAKILRSQFDVAPFAAMFFAMLVLLMLTNMLPVPGLRMSLQPPASSDLPGISRPAVSIAVDAQGRIYYQNQIVTEAVLKTSLAAETKSASSPLTLIIHADRTVSYAQLAHLAMLAREPEIGITNLLLATLPQPAETVRP